MMETVASISGLVATVWITLGVCIAAKRYPNYDHYQQFCSELGAAGSPTEKLSPRINNYPLGALFCLFGGYITAQTAADIFVISAGVLVIIHGIGTWVAGYFPMDKDPYTKTPSTHCKIHSWAGFVMLLALLIAPLLIAIGGDAIGLPMWFRVASVICVVLAFYYLVKMTKAVKQQHNVGLYQRISYWIKLLWLSALSVILAVS
ncbi:DUF998 domain-containing protein [Thalassotalea euphylliae]|uniref:DUF998 domain-containing protein n=1 Tax=Thalassotalea euphylliae TaxID=1655234 RepID=A0A3E0TWW1_9GAMM|nr:DUF998 domain-containing protein [Thalassotalea euphylliae]REL28833.1 DUF998 domain-containing protein [Thalassotalea euphylliae]